MTNIATDKPSSPTPIITVVGPTRNSGNILILQDGICVATVKHDPARDAQCRQLAGRLARADARAALLRHLLSQMQADEGRWSAEIDLVKTELQTTGE